MADAVPGNDFVPQVLIEIQNGEGQSLSATGRQYPAHHGPGRVDPSTVYRWVTKGIRAADGRVVKLEAARVGARWLTSRSAAVRFLTALTTAAAPTSPTTVPVPITPAARRRASEDAATELKKMGV